MNFVLAAGGTGGHMIPATPAAASPPRIRIETPASASIATHTAQKMIVLPKSGCFISRKAMVPVRSADKG